MFNDYNIDKIYSSKVELSNDFSNIYIKAKKNDTT